MSGAYSIFPLRLVVVFNLNTTTNRNIPDLFVTDNQVSLLAT